MAADNRFGSRPSKLTDASGAPGVRFDAGPYIGVIKNNVDANRSGRLQVFIPDLGGQEDNPTHWRTVQYASPFFGMTTYPAASQPSDNDWKKVSHTYGIWFTPPDIDNQVLITFVMGNPSRGYWFACINPTVSHNMMPGISGSSAIDRTFLSDDLKAALTGEQYPTVEFNETNPTLWNKRSDFVNIPKPVHEEQVRILLEQGLEDDLARGVTSSSSQRESPSTVFGISTPGRDSGSTSDLDPTSKSPHYRLGGHQFIMDDGDAGGIDQMIRLRTSGGHQIMLNDSEDIIYIANSLGTAWMEFTSEGKIHMFSAGQFSLRTEKEINLHSDTDINMYAGNNINMYATNAINATTKNIEFTGTTEYRLFAGLVNVKSDSALNMTATTQGTWKTGADMILSTATQGSWNGGNQLVFSAGQVHLNTSIAPQAPDVVKPIPISVEVFPDAVQTGLKWTADGAVNSSVTIVPTHEPWTVEHNTVNSPAALTPQPAPATAPDPVMSQPGPKSAVGKGVVAPASSDALSTQPTTNTAIGNLTATQSDALKAQIGNATGGNYSAISSAGTLGKYQLDASTLTASGLVLPGTANSGLTNPANWTGQNGIANATSFLNSPSMQESVMDSNLTSLHSGLVSSGAVNKATSPTANAGLLSVAHSLGLDSAISWLKGTSSTQNGTQLFNQGRYATDVLAQTPTSSTISPSQLS